MPSAEPALQATRPGLSPGLAPVTFRRMMAAAPMYAPWRFAGLSGAALSPGLTERSAALRSPRRTGRAPGVRQARAPACLFLHDVEELDLEHERGLPRDPGGLAAVAVRDGMGADELRLPAHLQLLQALRPAGDDLVQRELGGRAALHRRVELRAVHQRPDVVHRDGVGGLGAGPRAFLEGDVDEAARAHLRALLLRRLLQIGLRLVVLLVRGDLQPRLLELADLLAVALGLGEGLLAPGRVGG